MGYETTDSFELQASVDPVIATNCKSRAANRVAESKEAGVVVGSVMRITRGHAAGCSVLQSLAQS